MPTPATEVSSTEMQGCAPPETPLLVACHDAGAANLVFAWLRHWIKAGLLNYGDLLLALKGPALDIAERSGLAALATPVSLEKLPAQLGCVLSGTGWQSDWEHRARQLAHMRNIHSIAVIDHWVNYPARFIRDDVTCLPDALWVSDKYAERLARAAFPALAVKRLPNLYLAHETARIPPLDLGSGDTIYLLEPTRTTWGRQSEGEFQALDYFIQQRHLIPPAARARIRLRLHPSEPDDKYDAWLTNHQEYGVCRDDSGDLAESIGRASVVVGIQTAAMVVALAAGRRVYSSLPPWAGEFALPHDGITQLRLMR